MTTVYTRQDIYTCVRMLTHAHTHTHAHHVHAIDSTVTRVEKAGI